MRAKRAKFQSPKKHQKPRKKSISSIGSKKQFIVVLKLPQRRLSENWRYTPSHQSTLWDKCDDELDVNSSYLNADESFLMERNANTARSRPASISFSFHEIDMDRPVEGDVVHEELSQNVYNLLEINNTRSEGSASSDLNDNEHACLIGSILNASSTSGTNTGYVAPRDVLFLPPLSNFMGPSSSELYDTIKPGNESNRMATNEMKQDIFTESDIGTDYCELETSPIAGYNEDIDSSFELPPSNVLHDACDGTFSPELMPKADHGFNSVNSAQYETSSQQGRMKEYIFPSASVPNPACRVSMDNMVLYTKNAPPRRRRQELMQSIRRRAHTSKNS